MEVIDPGRSRHPLFIAILMIVGEAVAFSAQPPRPTGSRAPKELVVSPILRSLQARHRVVQEHIDAEQARPRPDPLTLQALKKLRLFFRDRIEILERQNSKKAPVIVVTRRSFGQLSSAKRANSRTAVQSMPAATA